MTLPPSSTGQSGPLSPDDIAMNESAARLRASDPVDVAAIAWHGRREQGLDADDEVQFRLWLAADPAHRAAFSRLDEGLRALRALPAERTAHLRARPQAQSGPAASTAAARPAAPPAATLAATPAATPAAPPQARSGLGARLAAALTARPAALAFCCVAVLALGVGWRQWWRQPTFEHVYTAQRGQLRDVVLPDGTRLTLDSGTRVEVTLYRDRRLVRLPEGQAMFGVARDAARPFTVLAGPARVTVLGTRFAVRCRDCAGHAAVVEIEVEEGRVGVARAGLDGDAGAGAGKTAQLHAGQFVRVSTAAGLGAVAAVNPGGIAPWRKGLIRFVSTPLAEAVREFERYGAVNLVVSDPEVASMPIGGSYRAANPAAFAQALPHILPVRLVRRADGKTEVVRAK
ncbi:FecR domain-containing protein [Oxalobacteraceae bacterium OTU3CAMAD1]|nr:FecR domain-containing protein [Oxalobacteraceae bacterium OTU3CAMAD1]